MVGGAAAAVLLMARTAGSSSPAAAGAVVAAKVQRLAEAIAWAEGFYTAGSVPQRNNNPGDLKISSVASVGADKSGHLIFKTAEDGWRALRLQLELIAAGRSSVYTKGLNTTISEMASHYAEWSGNWSHNVAARLGVTEGTTLRAVLT